MIWCSGALVGLGLLLLLVPLPVLDRPRVSRAGPVQVDAFLDVVLDEQRAGQTPFIAVSAALRSFDLPVPRDPVEASELLAQVSPQYAALWRLLYLRGSGLFEAAQTLRDAESQRRALAEEIEVKVAASRSTTRLLLALPWAFLVVGQATGLRSLSILLTTVWGFGLIAVAGALTWFGMRWVDRIIASVTA